MKNISVKVFIGLILIIGFLVYLSALPNDFVWDDEEQIANNLIIRDWNNLPLIFTSSTFYGGGAGLSGGFYRPLVTLSYFFNYHIWKLIPLGFRFFQVIIHLLNLILIFLILKKIFSSQGIKYSKEISALAALLFAVHPVNVESVAYLGSIGEILYTFFILLAFLYFIKNKFYLGLFFSFLGLLSKETAVIIFPIFAFYLFIFANPARNDKEFSEKKQSAMPLIKIFSRIAPKFRIWLNYIFGSGLVIGIYLFLRLVVAKIPAVSSHLAPISTASFLKRALTIPYEITSYLRIIFFPKNLSISSHFVVSSIFDIRFWGALTFIILTLALIAFYIFKIRSLRPAKSKLSTFFILWFSIGLLPTLNIIPLDMTIAERWLYFPMIGLLAWISLLIVQLIQNFPKIWRKISYILLILIIIMLSIRTVVRASNWKNGLTLFSHDIQYSKNSFDLANNYGVELFRVKKIDEAEKHFTKSIKLQPKWAIPHNNLGAAIERKGDLEGALTEYKKAIELSDYYLAYENVGGVLLKMKKFDEAKNFLSQALLKFPRNANLKWELALVYLNENDTKKATSLLLMAFQDDPRNQKVIQLLKAIQSGSKI